MKKLILALSLIASSAFAVDEKVLINPVQDGNLTVKVNDGGTIKSVMTFQGSTGYVGYATYSSLTALTFDAVGFNNADSGVVVRVIRAGANTTRVYNMTGNNHQIMISILGKVFSITNPT